MNRPWTRLDSASATPGNAKGTYGHDVYVYTPQNTMIPSLYDIGRFVNTAADTPERWLLETSLVRERNRITDSLHDAGTLIADTLQRLG